MDDVRELWEVIRPLHEAGEPASAIAEELGVTTGAVWQAIRIARGLEWIPGPRLAPRRVTTAHVAGPAGDENHDQRCADCSRVLRLRRYAFLASDFLHAGETVYEVGGRLVTGVPSQHLLLPCVVGR